MKKLHLLLFELLAGMSIASAQSIHFDRLGINDGLSQNTVTSILQDERGFMWFGTKDGLNRYDGKKFKIFKHTPGETSGLGNSLIKCLVEAGDHRLWVGTDSGLYVYDPQTERFEAVPLYDPDGKRITKPVSDLDRDPEGRIWIVVEANGIFCHDPRTGVTENRYREKRAIRTLCCDRRGVIWFAGYGGGLFCTEDGFEHVRPFLTDGGEPILPKDIISYICPSDYNRLYLGLEAHGVVEVDLITARVTPLRLTDDPATPLFVRTILRYAPDELWIGTESGIVIYNTRTRSYQQLRSSHYDPYSLSDNAVYSLCKDREGGLWIGSFFGGINYLPRRNSDFEKYYQTDDPHSLQGRRVREICPDPAGGLWVGTEDAGLYHFDPATRRFDFFAPSRDFSNVHGLLMDGNDLWVSTFSKGIRVIDTRSGRIRSYVDDGAPGRIFSNYVFALCRTNGGRIYVGTMHGLQYYDPATDRFRLVPQINGGKMVNDIREDSNGRLWVATFSNGLYRYDARNDRWTQYLNDPEDAGSLPCDNITSVFEDSHGQIWLTTEGSGFCRFDPEHETFIRCNSRDGMPSDVVFQIVEDARGLFWITTNRGLVLFDPQHAAVRQVYTVADRLLSNQFNYKSSYRSERGIIYFGCIEGLISFDPERLTERRTDFVPPVYITDFSLLDEPAPDGTPYSPLRKSILCSDSLRLTYDQNSFSLQLAALGYREPQANRLLYRMRGVDDHWRRYTPEASTITYSKLDPGHYLFEVRLADRTDVPSRQLYIEVAPPFYLSAVAYVVYALLGVGLLVLIFVYHTRRNRRRQQQHIEAFEREKERELYNAKINFFTNIAHEIRTPLTLIKGPLENILARRKVDRDLAEDLEIMDRNTNRLLDLTNQLLDFQKIEKERLPFNLTRQNVADLVSETFYRFSSSARQQNKRFELRIDEPEAWAAINREAFTKILSNLFNNALKYSESMVRVELSRADATWRLTVTNDGEVVPAEMREAIFAPFFRHARQDEAPGTGIGLALARSLAELHHGTLTMGPSTQFNEFVLTLPADLPQPSGSPEPLRDKPSAPAPEPTPERAAEGYCILVVEDNAEMCAFIRRQLAAHYAVVTAENGVEALQQLEKNDISLIVSDVMMPRMDGIELCQQVKNDLRYSHIPLVLLTAKTTLQSKISGMDAGADAYIEKPFSSDYLLSVIANLIKNRQKLCEAFTKNPLVLANTMATSSADTDFIVRLQEIIHANFNNPEFKMNDIAEMMHMSRASFYRKIKGVLDMTPNDYLRLERLKTAAQLLRDKRYHINEVCYMVGFSSTSYFSKCFQKQFGVLPKNFAAETPEAPGTPEPSDPAGTPETSVTPGSAARDGASGGSETASSGE